MIQKSIQTLYWPEWNESFALPVKDFADCHRPMHETQDLAAILCHAEERVIANDYTFSFAGQTLSDRARSGAGGNAESVAACGVATGWRAEGLLSGQPSAYCGVRRAPAGACSGCAQNTAQGL